MKQVLNDLSEQAAELGQTIKKSVVQDLIKGIPKTAKQQITGVQDQIQVQGETVDNKAIKTNKTSKLKNNDPVTGKPIPSKKVITQLADATKRLRLTKLQKIREELEKQRNKVKDEQGKAANGQQTGPEVKVEDKKLDPGAVARTLKQSQSTGEMKGSVGG